MKKNILIVGTADTKSEELRFMRECIEDLGGVAKIMDVGILGEPDVTVEYTKHDVAEYADATIASIIALGNENSAMTKMAEGASKLSSFLYAAGDIDGVITLGGTMGTDLALDVTSSLPFGVPKYIVSTISFSHLIPPERISPDLSMMLWSGGLYGINSVCKNILRQACGAVLGAANATQKLTVDKPLIGMSSLGKTSLKYMVRLKPELEKRGFELIVFHTTGQGGRALEWLANKKRFAAVLDFSLQEVVNDLFGSMVTSGSDRLENCGKSGIPQIVAPGSVTIMDVPTWQTLPEALKDRASHTHNRLISSVVLNTEELKKVAKNILLKLAKAKGDVKLLLPLKGTIEWDREGKELHNPKALDIFFNAIKSQNQSQNQNIDIEEVDGHINDDVFIDRVLEIFDDWLEKGIIKRA